MSYALRLLLLLGAPDTTEVRTGAAEIARTCRHEAPECSAVLAVLWQHEAHFVLHPRRRGGGIGPCQVTPGSSPFTSAELADPGINFMEAWRIFQVKRVIAKGSLRGAFEGYSGRPTRFRFAEWAMRRMEVVRRVGVGRAAAASTE